jgi:heat shock protein 90kDa beta
LHDFALKAKNLEINPRSPLIEGLLWRVEESTPEQGRDLEAEELKEVASILIDGALVRSGFEVTDSNRQEKLQSLGTPSHNYVYHRFFERIDRVLRRSLGVSETAPTDTTVKPAPQVDPELPSKESDQQLPYVPPVDGDDDGKAKVIIPEHLKNDVSF